MQQFHTVLQQSDWSIELYFCSKNTQKTKKNVCNDHKDQNLKTEKNKFSFQFFVIMTVREEEYCEFISYWEKKALYHFSEADWWWIEIKRIKFTFCELTDLVSVTWLNSINIYSIQY